MGKKDYLKKFEDVLKRRYVKEGLIVFLFLLYFRNALVWIFNNLTNKESYEYGLLFVVLIIFIGIWIYKNYKKLQWEYSFSKGVFIGFFLVLSLDIINTLFFHFFIVSAIAFFFGIYFILGFFIERNLWKRLLFIFGIVGLTLPFVDHIQVFFGFPIRIFTAKVVSMIFEFMGIANFTESSVIITENNASNIDLPCSGIKSIYTGTIFMLFIYFLKNVKVGFRLFLSIIVFYFSLLFFNLWRVFSLVYIYDVLDAKNIGDTVHIFLGIVGFLISAFILWYFVDHLVPSKNKDNFKEKRALKSKNFKYLIIVLIVFILLDAAIIVNANNSNTDPTNLNEVNFSISIDGVNEVALTEKEEGFFNNKEVVFAKKFEGKLDPSTPYSLLLVNSKTWRSHHDPEICIQGSGHSINDSEILGLMTKHPFDGEHDIKMKKLSLEGGGMAIYWFVGKDKIVTDYSQRVWEGILSPDDSWTLVVMMFNKEIDINNSGVVGFISDLNKKIQKE